MRRQRFAFFKTLHSDRDSGAFKSQKCKKFYKDGVCEHGEACHFRHNFQSFEKIKRHHYLVHLKALAYRAD